VSAAARGNGMTSDPGYYERALAWDDHMAAVAEATRIGFTATPRLERESSSGARLCVALQDAQGAVTGAANVRATASANLCPRERMSGELLPIGDAYCMSVNAPCVGVWVVDVQATVHGKVVAAGDRAELGAAR
jgi:hypothetical protein